MMPEGSVPVDHKENDERERKVHNKEHPTACAVFDQLGPHPLAGGIFLGVAHQKDQIIKHI